MESEGTDVFDILDFDFMPIGMDMAGKIIQDTPWNELMGEDSE